MVKSLFPLTSEKASEMVSFHQLWFGSCVKMKLFSIMHHSYSLIPLICFLRWIFFWPLPGVKTPYSSQNKHDVAALHPLITDALFTNISENYSPERVIQFDVPMVVLKPCCAVSCGSRYLYLA